MRFYQKQHVFNIILDPRAQIQSYVFDVIRSAIPRMELDETFVNKKDIALAILNQLKDVMKEYGYEIIESLVTDIMPDQKVLNSMNQINASKRLKEAATHKAEADKIRQVKAAEAEAEARYLSGLGVARQRKAVVEGLQLSLSDFNASVPETNTKDVMDILLLTQYFDTLTAIGSNNMILEHEPLAVENLKKQLSSAFLKSSDSNNNANRKTDFSIF